MKKNSFIIATLFFLLDTLAPILCGLVGTRDNNVVVENEAGSICNIVNKNSTNGIIYSQTDILDNNGKSISKQYYSYSYGYNKTEWMKQAIVCGDRNDISNFLISYDGHSFSSKIALVDAVGYTNNNKRFESLDIELFFQRNRVEELSYNQAIFDNVVYIPDLYANFLLNEVGLSSYDDLLKLDKPIEIMCSSNDQTIVRKYKIANIFNTHGSFPDNSKPTDFANILSEYLKCFCVTPDQYFFDSQRSGTICLGMIQSKKYCLIQYFSLIGRYLAQYHIDGNIYYSTVEGNKLCSTNFIGRMNPGNFSKTNILPIITIVSFSAILVGFYIIAFFVKSKVLVSKKTSLALVIYPLSISMIFELVCRIVYLCNSSSRFLLFANNYLFIMFLIEILFSVVFFAFKRLKK